MGISTALFLLALWFDPSSSVDWNKTFVYEVFNYCLLCPPGFIQINSLRKGSDEPVCSTIPSLCSVTWDPKPRRILATSIQMSNGNTYSSLLGSVVWPFRSLWWRWVIYLVSAFILQAMYRSISCIGNGRGRAHVTWLPDDTNGKSNLLNLNLA